MPSQLDTGRAVWRENNRGKGFMAALFRSVGVLAVNTAKTAFLCLFQRTRRHWPLSERQTAGASNQTTTRMPLNLFSTTFSSIRAPQRRWGMQAAPLKAKTSAGPFAVEAHSKAKLVAPRSPSGAGLYSHTALLREVTSLQDQVGQQAQQLEELHQELEERDSEGEELRKALNLERFKYELLVDLWAMRVLDNEEVGAQREAEMANEYSVPLRLQHSEEHGKWQQRR